MTVEKLSENRALIILCSQDIRDFSLSFDTLGLNDIHSRRILLRIMRLACQKTGLEINGKNVQLEAIEIGDDCYILITADKILHKRYKIKGSVPSVCYKIGNSSNFLEVIEKLYRQNIYCNKNSAYLYNDNYYLIFDYCNVPKQTKRILSEYCAKKGSKIESARVKENGKKICDNNAVYQIGKHLI